MLEILMTGRVKKVPEFPPPISGYNFTTGSTSVLTTTVNPMTLNDLPSGTIPALTGYSKALTQGAVASVSTMLEVARIGTGDFTFEHWIARTGNNGFGFNIRNSSGPVFVDGFNSSSQGILYGLGFQSSGVTLNSFGVVNTWRHTAYVRKAGVLRAFVDGRPVAMNNGAGLVPSLPCPYNLSLMVPGSSGIHSVFWDFRWAEFAISNFAKYDGQFTPDQPLY